MEYGLNVTLDDNATFMDVVNALRNAAAKLHDRPHLDVDEQSEIDSRDCGAKTQDISLNRYC